MRAIVIGAGPAGLACAACLSRRGVEVEILDRAEALGARWRAQYDRLRLHTSRRRSGLPGMPMPADWPRYVDRWQVVEYLEAYAEEFGLRPVCGAEVRQVMRDGNCWRVSGTMGERQADVVVFATGVNDRPWRPEIAGLDGFDGPVLHSSAYRNPDGLPGPRALVVGFGNSGGDIALDLAEAGREVNVVVRGPVNLLPKELFGIPITSFEFLTKVLPVTLADSLTAPLLRAAIGRPEDYGMVSAALGPATQVVETGRIPLIGGEALDAIKAGAIRVRPGIERFEGNLVRFVDGTGVEVDGVVLATGYRVDLRRLLPEHGDLLDGAGRPLVSGGRTAAPGLYFCSYKVSASGQLRQMSREAEAIARDVANLTGR